MRSKNKALLLLLCAVLLVAVSVFGTLAYLTDHETVRNTFTVGSVGLKLDEADVKPDGTYETDAAKRVQTNEYHLLPGHTYIKDPAVTVEKGSEEAYIRMIVTVNNLDLLKKALPDSKYYADLDGDDQTDDFALELLLDNSWNGEAWPSFKYTESADGKTGTYEYRYHTTVDASDAADDVKLEPLFEKIKIPGEMDNTHLVYLDDVEIVVNAHAIQADGFENNEDGAWTAFGVQNP